MGVRCRERLRTMSYPSTLKQPRERGLFYRSNCGRAEWTLARSSHFVRCCSVPASVDNAGGTELREADWLRVCYLSLKLARTHSGREAIQAGRLYLDEGGRRRAPMAPDADERRTTKDSSCSDAASFADSYRKHWRR